MLIFIKIKIFEFEKNQYFITLAKDISKSIIDCIFSIGMLKLNGLRPVTSLTIKAL